MLSNPGVDLRPGVFGAGREVDNARSGGILCLEDRGEWSLDLLAFLNPEPVRDLEFDRLSLGRGEGLPQRRRRRGNRLTVIGHAEYRRDLSGRLSAGSGVGHCECFPDACRREDRVAVTRGADQLPGELGRAGGRGIGSRDGAG